MVSQQCCFVRKYVLGGVGDGDGDGESFSAVVPSWRYSVGCATAVAVSWFSRRIKRSTRKLGIGTKAVFPAADLSACDRDTAACITS